jgi:hypothetical protein
MKILFKVAIAADEVSDRSRGVTALGRRLGDYHWVMNNHRFLTLWRNYDIANLSEVMMVGWVEGIELNFFGADLGIDVFDQRSNCPAGLTRRMVTLLCSSIEVHGTTLRKVATTMALHLRWITDEQLPPRALPLAAPDAPRPLKRRRHWSRRGR